MGDICKFWCLRHKQVWVGLGKVKFMTSQVNQAMTACQYRRTLNVLEEEDVTNFHKTIFGFIPWGGQQGRTLLGVKPALQ